MKRRSAIPVMLGLIAVLLLGLLTYALVRTGPDGTQVVLDTKVERGQIVPAPDSDRPLPGLTTTKRSQLSDFRGQIVVLNFWASWCQPCAEEAPILEQAHRALVRGRAGTVLGITFNDTPDDSVGFVKKFGLTYPSLRDPGTPFAQAYGVRALPETFVLDREGRIRAIARGQLTRKFLAGALKRTGFALGSEGR
ncbi:TlpA disulfide reductase family protein [Patulibacter sp. NPDC049589]|uniref:TlpA family protein disulfide reductase n=1 Tax=Patulibacter sp. NPDC049589 TaxID=3154731 RepID=UPI00343C7DBB